MTQGINKVRTGSQFLDSKVKLLLRPNNEF